MHSVPTAVAQKRAEAFGVMKIDGSGRIVDFAEKPKGEAQEPFRVDTTVLGLDAERCIHGPCQCKPLRHMTRSGGAVALQHRRQSMAKMRRSCSAWHCRKCHAPVLT